MPYAKTALTLLRVGLGLYLLFIAATRLMGYQPSGSFQALYGYLAGGLPVNDSVIALGASIFLGLVGLVLLSGRLLVVGGILLALVGIVSGIGEFIAAQAPGLAVGDQFARLSNGVRDVLVLATTGGAIAALDSYIRHRAYRDTHLRRASGVTMYREGVPAEPVGTVRRTTVVDREEPRRPYP